ncbi:MAG TPA: SGNH/GDSL hydrolase family protein [Acidobacteriota bacterium]|nr:SGNH/GDSL hydrolase family protein [Acidobacteriota bacterium]
MKRRLFLKCFSYLPIPAILRGQDVTPTVDSVVWTDIRTLGVEGKGWTDTKSFYDRLPARAEGVVRDPVWKLSQNSAGLCVRFVTDAQAIYGRWTLRFDNLALPHMPATGVSGLDLYVRTAEKGWRWLAIGRPESNPTNTRKLVGDLPAGSREYLLYLPLYNGVSSVEIGVPEGAVVKKAPPRPANRQRPVLFYGTSITQGGCASRPGMAYTAILGRRLDRPVINLGFSGNGKMEPEMAELIAELDPALFVFDAVSNMSAEEISNRLEPFVRTVRDSRPHTPILLVENATYLDAFLVAPRQALTVERRRAYRAAYERLLAAGVPNLHYLPGDALRGEDGEATVDGTHPTDLGFLRQADLLEKPIRDLLAGQGQAGD